MWAGSSQNAHSSIFVQLCKFSAPLHERCLKINLVDSPYQIVWDKFQQAMTAHVCAKFKLNRRESCKNDQNCLRGEVTLLASSPNIFTKDTSFGHHECVCKFSARSHQEEAHQLVETCKTPHTKMRPMPLEAAISAVVRTSIYIDRL